MLLLFGWGFLGWERFEGIELFIVHIPFASSHDLSYIIF